MIHLDALLLLLGGALFLGVCLGVPLGRWLEREERPRGGYRGGFTGHIVKDLAPVRRRPGLPPRGYGYRAQGPGVANPRPPRGRGAASGAPGVGTERGRYED